MQLRIAGDAGIIDQDVDRSEIGDDLFDAGRASVERGDVPFVDADSGFRLEFLCGLVVTAVVRRNRITGRLERLGNRGADAACPTRHQRNAGHESLPELTSSNRTTDDGRQRTDCRRPSSVGRRPFSVVYLSTHIAMPMPPPMHSVARPFLASRLPIS